jgi:hypothetical protein
MPGSSANGVATFSESTRQPAVSALDRRDAEQRERNITAANLSPKIVTYLGIHYLDTMGGVVQIRPSPPRDSRCRQGDTQPPVAGDRERPLAGLFDAYIAVDWSARSLPSPARPSPDSIWISERLGDATQDWYWRTRRGCRDFLEERIASHVDAGRRVLVGFDFAYGYPSGFAQAIGLSHDMPPWRLVWQELERLIEDAPDNSNNRFEVAAELNRRCGNETAGPFWAARTLGEVRRWNPPARLAASRTVGRWNACDKWTSAYLESSPPGSSWVAAAWEVKACWASRWCHTCGSTRDSAT